MSDIVLDLRHLKYAILVAEHGSFRRAAEILNLSQSTISRRIQLLERRLGVPKCVLFVMLVLVTGLSSVCGTASRAADGAPEFKKEAFNYSEFAKGKFSEVVTVTNPRRTLYVAGVGSEDENATGNAKILYPGDLYAQCKYAWDKIKRTLEKQGAGLGDVAKATTYVTDTRGIFDNFKCRSEVFAGLPQPAGTLVGVTSLAIPGMMIEVDVIAEVGK